MKKVYVAAEEAKAKGWNLLGEMVKSEGEHVVLCWVGGYHPYACHLFNPKDGGFYWGLYCESLPEGEHAFAKRMGWVGGKASASVCHGCGG